jgi:hypothetical protein
MKKRKIKVTIMKEETGYSAYATVGTKFISTQGETLRELKSNMLDATKLSFKGEGKILFEFGFTYDLESFFSLYNVINAKALSERIGMNQSLLAQYIKGIKKPSAQQTKKILMGVKEVGKELAKVEFVM